MLKSGDQVVIEGEGWWKGGARGDLVCRIEVEMPGEGWAAGMSRDQVRFFSFRGGGGKLMRIAGRAA